MLRYKWKYWSDITNYKKTDIQQFQSRQICPSALGGGINVVISSIFLIIYKRDVWSKEKLNCLSNTDPYKRSCIKQEIWYRT